MTIFAAAVAITSALPPRRRGLYIVEVPDTDTIDHPRTIYRAWRDGVCLGTVWRQNTGRWTALSHRRGRARLGFGTATAAAQWLDGVRYRP